MPVDVIIKVKHNKTTKFRNFYVTKCCYNGHFQIKRINSSLSKAEGLVKRIYSQVARGLNNL